MRAFRTFAALAAVAGVLLASPAWVRAEEGETSLREGLYAEIQDPGVLGPRIRVDRDLRLPKEFRTLRVLFVPDHGIGAPIARVRWEGAEPGMPEPGAYPATARLNGSGIHEIRLRVTFDADPRGVVPPPVERTLTVDATDISRGSIRARIVYPGQSRTPPIDLDGSMRVDDQDLELIWKSFGSNRGEEPYSKIADWDGTGFVDLVDLVAFCDVFEGWRGKETGANYGSGHVYPVTRHSQSAFKVPAPLYQAETDPPGFEPWIEWRVLDRDGGGGQPPRDRDPEGNGAGGSQVVETGPRFTMEFPEIGEHRVFAGLFGTEDDVRSLALYRVTVPTFDVIGTIDEGVAYTFEARTTPPGYEDYVTWYARTQFGTATPSNGRGRTFTVTFENTWGPMEWDPNGVYSWLGVQADDDYLDQDHKNPGFGLQNQAVCALPLPRARLKLGLGEEVDITTVPATAVTWSVAGGGTVNPAAGVATRFKAKKDPSVSTVTAKDANGKEVSIVFTVVKPTGIDNAVQANKGCGAAQGPPNNFLGVRTVFDQVVKPNDVSFKYVRMRENIPAQGFVWPDGTAGVAHPGGQPIWGTTCDNKTTDNSCRCSADTISRLDPPPPGGPLVAFGFDILMDEEYENDALAWVKWLLGENHPKAYTAAGVATTTINATNGVAAVGGPQGPWQATVAGACTLP